MLLKYLWVKSGPDGVIFSNVRDHYIYTVMGEVIFVMYNP